RRTRQPTTTVTAKIFSNTGRSGTAKALAPADGSARRGGLAGLHVSSSNRVVRIDAGRTRRSDSIGDAAEWVA
ncbi:MAG TPA: hypothetical protein VFF72_09035, partial [Caldimonas sp.]|nr:hypothetical protein [Caldimonas sp.]